MRHRCAIITLSGMVIVIMNDNDIVSFNFGGTIKQYPIIEDPMPHYLVDSTKEIHGWIFYDYQDHGKRECSQERLLINPYGGCHIGCKFCYTRGMRGYYQKFWKTGAVAVCRNYDVVVKKQISRLYSASCGYLSPTTDGFQPLNDRYRISDKIVDVFSEVGLPVEFITKRGSGVSDHVLNTIAKQSHNHSFAQYTILPSRNYELIHGADPYDEQLKSIARAREVGIKHVVARFDPIIPYMTDKDEIKKMFGDVKDAGATHVIMSCMDIPIRMKNVYFEFIKPFVEFDEFKRLYEDNDQRIAGDLNAETDYRVALFQTGKELATKNGLTFSLCMEFEKIMKNGEVLFRGMNEDFMTSPACEGINIPIYVRDNLNDQFSPLEGCSGNCLAFAKNGKNKSCDGCCNFEPFKQARGLSLKHYRKFDRQRRK